MTRLPSVLGRADLPLAELCAARLDGELFPLDECFSVVDLPVGRAERAAALAAVLPSGCIADRESAAWVHGACADPPVLHSASIDREHRRHPPVLLRARFHEVRISASEVETFGAVRVTTAVRTAVDLARTGEEWTAQRAALLAGLVSAVGLTREELGTAIDGATRLPRRALARVRLDAAVLSPR